MISDFLSFETQWLNFPLISESSNLAGLAGGNKVQTKIKCLAEDLGPLFLTEIG